MARSVFYYPKSYDQSVKSKTAYNYLPALTMVGGLAGKYFQPSGTKTCGSKRYISKRYNKRRTIRCPPKKMARRFKRAKKGIKRRSRRGRYRDPVSTTKYQPTSSAVVGKRRRRVSKRLYRNVKRVTDGHKTQKFMMIHSLDDSGNLTSAPTRIQWTAYNAAATSGIGNGQATFIFQIGSLHANGGNDLFPNANQFYNSDLLGLFKTQRNTVYAPFTNVPEGAIVNRTQMIQQEMYIYLESMAADMTIENTQTSKQADVDVYEMLCVKDVPHVHTSGFGNSFVNEVIDDPNEFYNILDRMVDPPREGIVENRLPSTNYGFTEGYQSEMVQFTRDTLGSTPYDNFMLRKYFKIVNHQKMFLEPGGTTRLNFKYKVHKKISGEKALANIYLKGISRWYLFVCNNTDRTASEEGKGVNVALTKNYYYKDKRQTTSTRAWYRLPI